MAPIVFSAVNSYFTFVLANFEDPLIKREKFAVSLRREKTKAIINAKRMKLIQSKPLLTIPAQSSLQAATTLDTMTDNESMESEMQELQNRCLNTNCSYYEGYYKFIDVKLFERLLQEISPNFDLDGDIVSAHSQSYRSVSLFKF